MVLAISACKKEAVKNNYTATNGKTTNTNLNGTPADGLDLTYSEVNADLLSTGYIAIPVDPWLDNPFTNNISEQNYYNSVLNEYISVYTFIDDPNYLPGQPRSIRVYKKVYTGNTQGHIATITCDGCGTQCRIGNKLSGGVIVGRKVIICTP